MKTAKNNESIAAILAAKIESKTEARKKNLDEYKAEKAGAEKKIEALQAEQENADTPGAYKMNAAQIHEQEEFIKFLDKRAAIEKTTPLISKEEFNEIQKALQEANAQAIKANGAQILAKFNELVELMNEYTAAANEMQNTMNAAEKAHFGRTLGGHLWHELETIHPNKESYFEKFCRDFFNFRIIELNGKR